jgi:glutaminyl-tRNA synthetase
MRLNGSLFTEAPPEGDGKDFLENLNPNSLTVVTAYVEPSLASVEAGQRFQFERHGYFVTDLMDHAAEKAVFNRVTGMKDSWAK